MIRDQHQVDKGKGRAESPSTDERTPLLASPSAASNDPESSSSTQQGRRRSLRSQLTFVFLFSSAFGIILLVVVTLIAYSYVAKASHVAPDDIRRALVFQGPDRVDVLNVTKEGGIWMRVEGRVGLDVGVLIDVNSVPEDTVWDSIVKSIGRWGVKRIDKVTVDLEAIQIFPESDKSFPLASVDTPPVQLSLITNPPAEWLTPISIPILIHPTKDTAALANFMQHSWSDGIVAVQASIASARVRGGGLGDNDWRSGFTFVREDIQTAIRIESMLYAFTFVLLGKLIYLLSPTITRSSNAGSEYPISPILSTRNPPVVQHFIFRELCLIKCPCNNN
jgi:hypothetical protein